MSLDVVSLFENCELIVFKISGTLKTSKDIQNKKQLETYSNNSRGSGSDKKRKVEHLNSISVKNLVENERQGKMRDGEGWSF